MKSQSDAAPLSEEEIAQLSPQAQQILAARCAARVLPVLGYRSTFDYWGEDADRHMSAMMAALAVIFLRWRQNLATEALTEVALQATKAADEADATVGAFEATYLIADVAGDGAYPLASIIENAAKALVDVLEINADRSGVGTLSVRSIFYAVCRADWWSLLHTELPERILESALWIMEPPDGWGTLVSNFEKALGRIRRFEFFQLFRDLEIGAFEVGRWRLMFDTWRAEYGDQSGAPFFAGVKAKNSGGKAAVNKTAAGTSATKLSPKTEPVLKQGDKGEAVQHWQLFLRNQGFPVEPDGIFGKATHEATLKFQEKYDLFRDGIVGPQTWAVVQRLGGGVPFPEEEALEEIGGAPAAEAEPEVSAETPGFGPDHYRGGLVATQANDEAAKEDHLGREPLVKALAALLAHPASGGRLTIGLLGHWGAGKSSVLRMLEEALSQREPKAGEAPYTFATFNAWSYEHTGNIQAGLAQEVVNGLTGKLTTWQRLFLAARYAAKTKKWSFWGTVSLLLVLLTATIWRGVAGEFDAAGGVVLLALLVWRQGRELFSHPLAAKLQTYLRLPTFGEHLGELPVIQRQVKALCELCLQDPADPKRLLFMVDDLDRCGVEGVVQTLEAVRLVMDLPNVTVIVAVDHRMALAALTHHYHDLAEKGSARTAQAIARDYLGKIFQLPIQLGEPTPEGVEEYVNEVLFAGVVESEEKRQEEVRPPLGADAGGGPDSGATKGSVPEFEGKPEMKRERESKETLGIEEERKGPSPKSAPPVEPTPQTPKAPEPDPNEALADTPAERGRFAELAKMMRMGNPRQLKRLHNCYRLLKALHYHHHRGPSVEDRGAAMMAMLFWLEHLYECEWRRREAEEQYLLKEAWEFVGGPTLEGAVYEELRSVLGRGEAYERLRKGVIPLMLPFALLRHESKASESGKAEKPST